MNFLENGILDYIHPTGKPAFIFPTSKRSTPKPNSEIRTQKLKTNRHAVNLFDRRPNESANSPI